MPFAPLQDATSRGASEFMQTLDDFDQAWQGESPPDLGAFLRPEATEGMDLLLRRQLLEELVKIDLEYRWKRGAGATPQATPETDGSTLPPRLPRRPTLDSYLRLYPELL